ncbi:hypothetical protein O6H91_01G152600 [Diphasiastrum complanatum]|uniref:Uncharacterized protein n=2 Tax=Diphasiastrum complanatum TaxID=34168 RepID=A0ACC2EXS6_DIPCM|nr:hypothetical protein O6H91_01G151500 [Diphasiastrum complanatum]KAJ7571165.1 hypothetical protein O6H91_01G152600 [Diphasiastrum complanatum]
MARGSATEVTWSARLAVQLVRGLPGTLALHRRTVKALGLRRRHQTVFLNNTPTIRGMINQVKRLLSVETEEMFKERIEKEVCHKALRPPLIFKHSPENRTS